MKFIVGVGLIAFTVGFFARPYIWGPSEGGIAPSVQEGMQGLINPLLDCLPEKPHLRQSEIANSVQSVVNAARKRGDISDIGIYFRDLNNGPAFGINENMDFIPASLLKVPVMIAAFKRLESDPSFFSKSVVYDPKKHRSDNLNQLIQPPMPLEPGVAYPFDVLIARMITLSDNLASTMVIDGLEGDVVKTLTDMGIRFQSKGDDVWLDVRQYSSILRILYNATYLPRGYSSAALDLLTRCEFKDALPKGVPSGVQVAHKFGERAIGDGFMQFHDCGIIYHPQRPYLLCVMSRGKELNKLIDTVANISRTVYEEVSVDDRK